MKTFSLIELAKGSHSNANVVGGKGESLLRLINAEFSVPYGFIIPAIFYIDTLKENNVYEKVMGICESTTLDNLQENSAFLQEIIKQCNFSLVIEGLSQKLGYRVSVRSSAISEDGDNYSLAGLHDSFLNVEKNNIIKYVKEVWASLFTNRSMVYRLHNGLPLLEGMAVVVQNMIDAKCAGVVFTKHPVEQKYILVEVAPGIGSKLVDGIVTPDRYLFDRQTLELASSEITNEPLLDDKALQFLICNSMEIERQYGKPQDIEWAFDDKVYFLQSRAVVSFAMDSKVIELEKEHEWKRYVSRRSPLLWHSFTDSSTTRENWLKHTGEDIFISFKSYEYGKWADTEDLQRAMNYFKSRVEHDIRFNDGFCDRGRDRCIKVCNDLLSFCIDNCRCNYAQLSTAEIADIFRGYSEKNIAQATFRPYGTSMDDTITELLTNEIQKLGIHFRYEYVVTPKDLAFTALHKNELVIGAKMDCEGLNFGDRTIKILIDDHLEKYSWLATYRYIGDGWTEKDVINSIKKYLGGCQKKLDDLNLENEMRISKLNEIKAINPIIKNILRIAQDWAYLRTYRMDVAMEGDYRLRPMFLEIGKRFGLEYNDLIYLTHKEISAKLQGDKSDFVTKIKHRKEYFSTYVVNNDEIYVFDGLENKFDNSAIEINSDSIIGTVAKNGRVKGAVKVIKSAQELDKINEGDIIVTPMTTIDMAIVLQKCAGIITEYGGIACHAAQLSREFNIPCIIGAETATKVLKDGNVVEIIAEGTQGIVKIVDVPVQ